MSEITVSPKEQLRIIAKGAESIVSKEELLEKLRRSFQEQKPLTVKLGLDPTAPDIHLGHTVVLRKIRQMQDLGHQAVIVIGDFTGRIGDPTGKAKGRAALSEEQVRQNARTYCGQMFKVLDRSRTQVRFNSEWLGKLDFETVLRLGASTTVARMLERDDFQKRYQNQVPIGLHEFFYPLMQAYDSVCLHADIELGGTDQTFNILMGRTLQKSMGQEPQAALFLPILEGLDGLEKMSKSLGNYIGIDEPAQVMFKKVMEVPDPLILRYYELATDEHPDRVRQIQKDLENGKNPRDVKLELAALLTGLYHTPEETAQAREFYETAFSRKQIPSHIPALPLPEGEAVLSACLSSLAGAGLISSKSEFHRLLKQGGVQKNGEKLDAGALEEPMLPGDVLKIGKKKFVRFE